MDVGLKKMVDNGFMTNEQALYIENAISAKESVIVSGHKGWGILPLLATIGNLAKQKFEVKQIKEKSGLDESAEYYLIATPKESDFEGLIISAFSKDEPTITLKDPDHPYSIMKVLKGIDRINKRFCVVECAKIGEEKKVSNIKCLYISDSGKLIKEDGPSL